MNEAQTAQLEMAKEDLARTMIMAENELQEAAGCLDRADANDDVREVYELIGRLRVTQGLLQVASGRAVLILTKG